MPWLRRIVALANDAKSFVTLLRFCKRFGVSVILSFIIYDMGAISSTQYFASCI